MKTTPLIFLLAGLFAGATSSFAATFRAGAATANITPSLGIEMNGGTGPGHLSADYFGVFSERMKELLGAEKQEPLFNISTANGWHGYIPPPEQHAAGSYETWRGRTSPLATNAIPQITEAFLKLLEKVK